MTTQSFGRIMPTQLSMLMLAGYNLTRAGGAQDIVRAEDDKTYLENMLSGQSLLIKCTQNDCGYSLKCWREYLKNHNEFSKDYTYGNAAPRVEKAILAEIANPDRERLEALAEEMAKPES